MKIQSLIHEIKENNTFSDTSAELQALNRFLHSLEPCTDYNELFSELAPKARYIGPGKWLDTIRQTYT